MAQTEQILPQIWQLHLFECVLFYQCFYERLEALVDARNHVHTVQTQFHVVVPDVRDETFILTFLDPRGNSRFRRRLKATF